MLSLSLTFLPQCWVITTLLSIALGMDLVRCLINHMEHTSMLLPVGLNALKGAFRTVISLLRTICAVLHMIEKKPGSRKRSQHD
jgi:hypothetical protein